MVPGKKKKKKKQDKLKNSNKKNHIRFLINVLQSSAVCEVKDKCGKDATSWLKRDQTCPNPRVLSFSPMLGPWEGGTNITIRGINLGKEFRDIYGGITVAGIQCDPFESLYVKTEQIVCKVRWMAKILFC